jgi:protein TonB
MNNQPYMKAALISAVFHSIVLGLMMLAGSTMHTQPANAEPIEVTFVDDSLPDNPSTPSASDAQQADPLQAVQTAVQQSTAPAMQQSNGNGTVVLNRSYTGAATVGIPNAVVGNPASSSQPAAAPRPRGVSRPTQLSGPKPSYPAEARNAGWEGTVTLLVTVTADGSIGNVSVIGGSGHSVLDRRAAEQVKAAWRGSPKMQDGVAVESQRKIQIHFSLDEDDE